MLTEIRIHQILGKMSAQLAPSPAYDVSNPDDLQNFHAMRGSISDSELQSLIVKAKYNKKLGHQFVPPVESPEAQHYFHFVK